jgi:hypothetical protein
MRSPARNTSTAQFPGPEERARIMQRRAQLMRALIDALVSRDTDPQLSDAQIRILVADYGSVEVERLLDRLGRQFQRPRGPGMEEAWLYNEYVALHRRFGGTRSLLAAEELEALKAERAKLMLRRDFMGETLSTADARGFVEIGDLILADADLWDDLVPDDPPRAPQPPSRRQGRNQPCWCGSGRKYKYCHLQIDEEAPRNEAAR